MNVEMMKFLIRARSMITDGRTTRRHDSRQDIDLQAVERALPDCDWFELEQVRSPRLEQRLEWGSAAAPMCEG